MGGVDACFGRWDTPQHTLIDDGEPHGPEGSEQIWVGELLSCGLVHLYRVLML